MAHLEMRPRRSEERNRSGSIRLDGGSGQAKFDAPRQTLGITQEGLATALTVRENYRHRSVLCVPGEDDRILLPEYLLNHHIDLGGYEDPLPLAMMATRDPESPMAMAAATRLSPLGSRHKLINGVFRVVGEATKHPLVKRCVELITESAFAPDAIDKVRFHTSRFINHSRKEYSRLLKYNLQALLDGQIAPRKFVGEFFELTEAGNLHMDIRRKLISSLLLSENVRPGIKFLMLEHLSCLPDPTRRAIISAVLQGPPNHHTDIIKEELRWIISQERKTGAPRTPVASRNHAGSSLRGGHSLGRAGVRSAQTRGGAR